MKKTDRPPGPTPKAIKEVRHKAGLTQKDAGALIYGSTRSMEEYESGRRRMHPGLFELLRLKTDPVFLGEFVTKMMKGSK